MTLFLIIFIALGNNIQPSLGTTPSQQAIIGQSLELLQKCKVTLANGGDCSKHLNEQMEAMLLGGCKLAKSEPKLDDADRNCKALQKGGKQLLDDKSLVEKFQTNGQKMVAILKKAEKKKLSIKGLHGTLAEILSDPKNSKSEIVRFFVSLRKLLRLGEEKMSAGRTKQILNNVLAKNPVVIMPSNVMELMIHLWTHNRSDGDYHPEVRQDAARNRRKRRNNELAVNGAVFALVWVVAYLIVSFLHGASSMVGELLDYGFISLALSYFVFAAFIRQQRFYRRGAASFENYLNNRGFQTRFDYE